MTIRCVVRLLDPDARLLAWAEVEAETRGAGEAWATTPFSAIAERAGRLTVIDVHWTDLDVHFRCAVPDQRLDHGEVIAFTWDRPIFVIQGSRERVPPVTVRRSVTLGVPTGGVGIRGES